MDIISPEESIEAFVKCCQNKQCEIESTTIFSLQYLSIKYEYPEIIAITNEFIKEHSDELVYESLLFKTRQIKNSKNKYRKLVISIKYIFYQIKHIDENVIKNLIMENDKNNY